MTRPIRFAKPAADELLEAVRWYEARRPALGRELFDAVANTLELIANHPEIGDSTSVDHNTRRALVPRFPYQVVYRLRPEETVIVAVAHLKRRPGYWKTRS